MRAPVQAASQTAGTVPSYAPRALQELRLAGVLAALAITQGEHGLDAHHRPRVPLHGALHSAAQRAAQRRRQNGSQVACRRAGLTWSSSSSHLPSHSATTCCSGSPLLQDALNGCR